MCLGLAFSVRAFLSLAPARQLVEPTGVFLSGHSHVIKQLVALPAVTL